MQLYPYRTPDGYIHLVRKDDHDAVVAKLEAKINHWQSVAGQLAEALNRYDVEDVDLEDQEEMYVTVTVEDQAFLREALAAYESAKSGSLPDPLAEAVKRMEAVPWESLESAWDNAPKGNIRPEGWINSLNAVRARLIQAAKGKQP